MQSKLDFLRLATWDSTEYAYMTSDILHMMGEGAKRSKWLQYKGWKKNSVFVGHGEQKGQRHGVVNISGNDADNYLLPLLEWGTFYCTRIDVQITIPQPENVHLDEVYARIKAHVKSSLIQSEENDTLYIGARTSEIFTRLYEKILDKKYLRLEFEIKGKRARAAWRALQIDLQPDDIFSYYLATVKLPSDIKILFETAADGETEHAMRAEILKDDQNTLKWLQSIDGAMMKALANHNIGEQVEIILAGWSGFAATLDRMREEE